MAMFDKEMRHAVEFLPNRLYYVALSSNPPPNLPNKHFFSIDNEMVYWNFYLDFGPLNLGHVYRYCLLLNQKLSDPKLQDKVIFHYSHTHAHKRTNAAFLICSWFLLFQNKSPEEAFRPFKSYIAPFPPWHDATPSPCPFNLTILDTLKGLHKARELKWFDLARFDIEEYEFYEQVENGDLNWCLEGKFLAFAGPHAERVFSPGGYHTLRPDDYLHYFKKKNVTLVVRLNKSYYDARKFTSQGIDHIDLYFLDGSNPPDNILQKFLRVSEETPGAVAVHCKAGLGRTGTCIAAYMMKHYRVTAEEVIGWLRIVRPGSVIGPQQQFLKDIQQRMWRDGEAMRSTVSRPLSSLPVVAAAKDESSFSESYKRPSSSGSGHSNSNPALPYTPSTPQQQPQQPSSSSSSSLSKRMSKLSVSSPSNPNPTSTTPLAKQYQATTSSSSYTTTTPSSSAKQSYQTTPSSLPLTSSQKNTPSSSSHPYSNNSSSRPSSRSAGRVSEIKAAVTEEGDKDGSQGDLLRLRRAQHLQNHNSSGGGGHSGSPHLQNSAVYALSPSTATPPKNRLSFGFSSSSPNPNDSQKIIYSSNNDGGSGTPTSSSSRPRSRLGGFLSAWNK